MNKQTRDLINAVNSLNSTGPKTPEGKQRSKMNAFKHGLTGHNLMIQEDEVEAYQNLTLSLNQEHKPETGTEKQLVQQIIQCFVKLNRAAAFENNVFSVATVSNLTGNPLHDDQTETIVAQTKAWLDNEDSFEKMGRYTSRITRDLVKFQHELERVQDNRKSAALSAIVNQNVSQMAERLGLTPLPGSFCKTPPEPPAPPQPEAPPEPEAAPEPEISSQAAEIADVNPEMASFCQNVPEPSAWTLPQPGEVPPGAPASGSPDSVCPA